MFDLQFFIGLGAGIILAYAPYQKFVVIRDFSAMKLVDISQPAPAVTVVPNEKTGS